MARTTKPRTSTRRSARVHATAPTATAEPMQALEQGGAVGSQWARDVMGAWLAHARGLFDMAQTMQQAQVRALQDAANDFETAVDALEEAEDLAAVSAVPGRLLQAQWQHAMNNCWSATQRLIEIESAWLQQAHAQHPPRITPSDNDVTVPMSAVSLPMTQVGIAAAEAVTASWPAEWRKWAEQWQQGVEQLTSQAVMSVGRPVA
jgi:hypothetical protein